MKSAYKGNYKIVRGTHERVGGGEQREDRSGRGEGDIGVKGIVSILSSNHCPAQVMDDMFMHNLYHLSGSVKASRASSMALT